MQFKTPSLNWTHVYLLSCSFHFIEKIRSKDSLRRLLSLGSQWFLKYKYHLTVREGINHSFLYLLSVQLDSVAQSCLTLWDPIDCSTPGLPVHQQLLEFTQTHVHWISDAIQASHPLSSPSAPAFNLSQHQVFTHSLHQVAKVLELQLQHQSFQWTSKTDFL